jgi:hypothetical protein
MKTDSAGNMISAEFIHLGRHGRTQGSIERFANMAKDGTLAGMKHEPNNWLGLALILAAVALVAMAIKFMH